MRLAISAAERGIFPDWITQIGIRFLLRQRLREQRRMIAPGCEPSHQHLLDEMQRGPIAQATREANRQHYEIPAKFFSLVLGSQMKYSCCLWADGVNTLDAAEEAMLLLTCDRAGVSDGMRILDLGCGWGALSVWISKRYPSAQVLAVSNSDGQRRYIQSVRDRLGLSNLEVVVGDINSFQPNRLFDRIISVEMFEHMRNYNLLLTRLRGWLSPSGKLFVHLFSHHRYAYFFSDRNDADWMARNFFSGGIMPSASLLPHATRDFLLESQWAVSGRHYERTARAWLRNLDQNRQEIDMIFRTPESGSQERREAERWRLFFLACAELFGFQNGEQWQVSHYLMSPNTASLASP